jgi:peptidoglycan hydrolase CwlO-like protein
MFGGFFMMALISIKEPTEVDLKKCQEKLRECSESVKNLKKKIEAFEEDIKKQKEPRPKKP